MRFRREVSRTTYRSCWKKKEKIYPVKMLSPECFKCKLSFTNKGKKNYFPGEIKFRGLFQLDYP